MAPATTGGALILADVPGLVEDVVIGSGPTGMAAALGVIARGGHPVIVDFGPAASVAPPPSTRGVSGIALKGDDERARLFSYPAEWVVSDDATPLPLSSARGGLSRIWGAGILLRSQSELGLPRDVADEIAAGYEKLALAFDVAGADDHLSRRFPWVPESVPPPQSRRYQELAAALEAAPSSQRVLAGRSRLALDAGSCTRCGQCLTGCPDGLFLSARDRLVALADQGLCTFVEGPVSRIRDAQGCALELPTSVVRARNVFVAAGPIATPALLQRSGLIGPRVIVRDSAVFYAGFLNLCRPSGDEHDFTAAQLVAYASHPGPGDFQISLYESNPDYVDRLRRLMPKRLTGARLHSPRLAFLNPAIGFLDSDVSGTLEIRQRPSGASGVLRVPAPRIRSDANRAVRDLSKVLANYGVRRIVGAVLVPPVGSGYHSGASLPLGGGSVDYGGALRSQPRVFVVDASSLPKVWAGSHTFTAMANAFRIATNVGAA